MILGLILAATTAQASDRDCTCRGETPQGRDITIVYNGRTGLNSMAEAHVQIKVDGTAQKYYKNLPVYWADATVGQKYWVKGPEFKLTLNIPASLKVGDLFTAEYNYSNKWYPNQTVTLNCKATQIQ